MPYLNKKDATVGHSIYNVRAVYPTVSIPEGESHGDFEWYAPAPPVFDSLTQVAVEIAPQGGVQRWRLDSVPMDVQQQRSWERIKAERDRRKSLGVKVGSHWYHSDDASRIQQLALVMMGQGLPAALQWKTLTNAPTAVFVTMTPALALGIFQATAASDQAIFAAAEVHRASMLAHPTPGAYDFSKGWPLSIEEERA